MWDSMDVDARRYNGAKARVKGLKELMGKGTRK